MSRPAARTIRQRTVPCPVCLAHMGRPCTAYTPEELARAADSNRWTVRPHKERLVLEQAEREGRRYVTYGSQWGGPKVHRLPCRYAGGDTHGYWTALSEVPDHDAKGLPIEDCKICGGRGTDG